MLVNLTLGFVLDLIIGDPDVWFHPIRLIGSMLSYYERLFYRMGSRMGAAGTGAKTAGGLLLVISSLATVFLIMIGLEQIKGLFSLPFSVNLLTIVLIFFAFCNRSLMKEAKAVHRCLMKNDMNQARKQLARIVGRDTALLDKKAVIRATVETIAENVVDGFTAPIFYLSVGGVPSVYAYKTVNTIDSMFGYRNERYEYFGKPGARLDDILNYIPARLNLFFLFCASMFRKDVLKAMLLHGRSHPSPNSGIAEAGFAGFLGIALGGPSDYGGKRKEKPWIWTDHLSEEEREDPALILKALSLYMRVVGATFLFFFTAAWVLPLPLLFR